MSWVSTPPGYDYYDEQDPNTNGNEDGEGEEDEEGEEPWLDTPERLRLILGLVAEFTEGSVSKVESEVGPFLRIGLKLISLAGKVAGFTYMAGWTRRKCCCYHSCCATSRII
jgi:hypothetical protein